MKQVEQGMKHPVMLYKHPGPHLMGKKYFDYTIVDKCNEKAYDAALADGWFESMPKALENSTGVKEEADVTSKAAIQKAKDLRAGKK